MLSVRCDKYWNIDTRQENYWKILKKYWKNIEKYWNIDTRHGLFAGTHFSMHCFLGRGQRRRHLCSDAGQRWVRFDF
jgi:hypothetical protein